MNTEGYNYYIKSSSGRKEIINGEEFDVLDNKEVYITEFEAVRGYMRLRLTDKNLKLYHRIPNTTKWEKMSFKSLLEKIKKMKTKKAKRALKGVDEKW